MASFGEELKRERELRDISLKEISEATKISIRFLEALEQNDFDILPGGIFNRGFIRAYARFIGIDGEEMVNAYLHEVSLRESRQAAATRGAGAAGMSSGVFRPDKSPGPPASGEEPVAQRKIAFETRASTRSLADLAEGRNSLILWIVVIATFLIGAGVIVISMMTGDGPDPAAEGLEQARKARLARKAGESAAETSRAEPLQAGQASPVKPPAQQPPVIEKAPPPKAEAPPREPAAPEIVKHRVRIEATETTRVQIQCAGSVSLDQELWPGQIKTVSCEEPVYVSADNAGAVIVSLDGASGNVLGELGQRVQRRLFAPLEPDPPPAGVASPEKSTQDAGI